MATIPLQLVYVAPKLVANAGYGPCFVSIVQQHLKRCQAQRRYGWGEGEEDVRREFNDSSY